MKQHSGNLLHSYALQIQNKSKTLASRAANQALNQINYLCSFSQEETSLPLTLSVVILTQPSLSGAIRHMPGAVRHLLFYIIRGLIVSSWFLQLAP